MLDGWTIVVAALGYVTLLFGIAWAGDQLMRGGARGRDRPLTYALSLAVYCTSWTFFGSVGLAAATGYDFLPVYIGPILLFVFGWRFIQRLVRLAKSQNITSVADFLAARYGKSQAVSAIVTLIAVASVLPYIALQLKAVSISVETLIGRGPLQDFLTHSGPFLDTALLIAIGMAAFAMLFGTRHIDATEHQQGLMLAIAAESLVKLATFLTVGIFVTFWVFDGFGDIAARVMASPEVHEVFARGFNGGSWLTVAFLSMAAIVLLPRQFHVTVVENNSPDEIARARWLFPLYLVLINIFVMPIAAAGLLTLPRTPGAADMFVLALPMAAEANAITLLAFLGGLSAATAMVIVDSVALAIMICNGLVVPLLLRNRLAGFSQPADMARTLLNIRRVAIFAIIFLGYLVYRALGHVHGLATIGLLSFAAIAQLAPAFLGGLTWRKATAHGAIAGIVAGFAVWTYTLLVPWIVRAGWLPVELLTEGPFGIGFLKPQALIYMQFEPLTHGVLWSLSVNTLAYIAVSLLRAPEPIERLQAHVFVSDDLPRATSTSSFRMWRTSITVGDLQQTVARYLGAERAERSFQEYAAGRNMALAAHAEADVGTIRLAEHLLASAIGAASARLVLSLLLRRSDVGSQSALRLLDDATEALQYNRDLLQSALDQVRHGLGVFDKNMQLICWNRQFRELLDLPPELGRVGVPLERILRTCAERGDLGPGAVDQLVADRLMRFAVSKETFQERLGDRRILEIRSAPMPQGGIVSTFSDITERVAAATDLARANETLERRVRERTAELTEVNQALAVAKVVADEANLDKTRFIAAASHDILQPLNAARLYASSLAERELGPFDSGIARNIDQALQSVEEIFAALIEISRLDAGRMEPEFSDFALGDLLEQLAVEFQPLAREKNLDLRLVSPRLWVHSDRRLLRRVLQNLISNAIKYTTKGRVLIGCRRRGGEVEVAVYDSGPGIPSAQHQEIFKEFKRLDATASAARGLGLGLSIVERIGRVLGHKVEMRSEPGRGSMFAVIVPHTETRTRTGPPPLPRTLGRQLDGTLCLCIDNEPQVLAGMRTLLEGWGCEVLAAASIEEACRAIRGREAPDIVLADYHLDNATGIEAIAAIETELGHAVAAVVITADQTPEVQREIRLRGVTLLRKPLRAAALRAVVTRHARQPAAVAAE